MPVRAIAVRAAMAVQSARTVPFFTTARNCLACRACAYGHCADDQRLSSKTRCAGLEPNVRSIITKQITCAQYATTHAQPFAALRMIMTRLKMFWSHMPARQWCMITSVRMATRTRRETALPQRWWGHAQTANSPTMHWDDCIVADF